MTTMKKYDYIENMKNDIKEALESYDLTAYDNREELESELYDSLWDDDSVTGNGSGSYTFCRETAKDYVLSNIELVNVSCIEFCTEYAVIGNKFLNEEWEWFDVTIRCYLLGQVISKVLDDMGIK